MKKLLIDKFLNEIMFLFLGCDDFFVSHFLSDFSELDVSIGMKILLTELSDLQEALKRILTDYGFKFGFFDLCLILLGFLIENWVSIAYVGGFLFLQFVFQCLSKSALSVGFTHFSIVF